MTDKKLNEAIALKDTICHYLKIYDDIDALISQDDLKGMITYLKMKSKFNPDINEEFTSCIRSLMRKERDACHSVIEKYKKQFEEL